MDFESIINMPVIGQTIAYAIEDGRQWGLSFANNFYWVGNRDNIANLMILESTVWSVGNGILSGLVGLAGIPTDIAITLYSNVKLASALFALYSIDVRSESSRLLVLAAAAGVSVSELANELGTKAASQAIQKALMSIPGKTFAEINKALGIKLISKAGEKTLVNVAKIIPFIGSAVGGTVNGVMMNACGHSVIAFIKAWNRS
ncbi:EcsC family protein [Nostoc sp.]|uniref:EcsC family protein n=1 Tax=Nostoc sp. TaxID=1180 RepID=UPI002FF6347E